MEMLLVAPSLPTRDTSLALSGVFPRLEGRMSSKRREGFHFPNFTAFSTRGDLGSTIGAKTSTPLRSHSEVKSRAAFSHEDAKCVVVAMPQEREYDETEGHSRSQGSLNMSLDASSFQWRHAAAMTATTVASVAALLLALPCECPW